MRVAHAAPRAERHLAVLDVVARGGEHVVVAGVIVVHVGKHHVRHRVGLHADGPQPLGRRAQDAVLRAMEGRPLKKFILVPKRIVNVVV